MLDSTNTPATTGIGSLPHHNIDAALAFSFQNDIPFLPQIPIRNPWEFMIAQALEGMPGLQVEKDGLTTLNRDVWIGRSRAFNERLLSAYASASVPSAFEAFEPSSAASSSWQPFLWELEERKIKLAKIQLAGPLTSQWVLRLEDGSPIETYPEISAQIFRLVLARALGMSRRLQAGGIKPLLFIDEPGLYAFNRSNPRHLVALQELKVVIQTLRKEKVLVGLHCCSNTDWNSVLQLGLDVLSIDAGLSLEQLLESGSAMQTFLANGGRLSLGVIPATHDPRNTNPSGVREKWETLKELMYRKSGLARNEVQRHLGQALFTPACGLALETPTTAETILANLSEFVQLVTTNAD